MTQKSQGGHGLWLNAPRAPLLSPVPAKSPQKASPSLAEGRGQDRAVVPPPHGHAAVRRGEGGPPPASRFRPPGGAVPG